MRDNYNAIVRIGDCLVSSDVFTEYFACDYPKCKGCCCIIGDSGAPLEEDELESIERNYPVFSPLMRPEGRAAVDAKGFFEIDVDGDLVTPLVPGSEECAFCHFDSSGNCFCSIERKWFAGESDWRKPISCALYPIRLSSLGNGLTAMNLHRWDICRDAYEKGKREGIRVYQFLREPIERRFGADFWQQMDAASKLF